MIILIISLFIYGYYLRKNKNSSKKILRAILFLLLLILPLQFIFSRAGFLIDEGYLLLIFILILPNLIAVLLPFIAYENRWFGVRVKDEEVTLSSGEDNTPLKRS